MRSPFLPSKQWNTDKSLLWLSRCSWLIPFSFFSVGAGQANYFSVSLSGFPGFRHIFVFLPHLVFLQGELEICSAVRFALLLGLCRERNQSSGMALPNHCGWLPFPVAYINLSIDWIKFTNCSFCEHEWSSTLTCVATAGLCFAFLTSDQPWALIYWLRKRSPVNCIGTRSKALWTVQRIARTRSSSQTMISWSPRWRNWKKTLWLSMPSRGPYGYSWEH